MYVWLIALSLRYRPNFDSRTSVRMEVLLCSCSFMLGDPGQLEAVWSAMTTCQKAGMLGGMLER